MSLYRKTYRIESARYRSWDYAATAWYFVTLCTKGHVCCFGTVRDADVRLTPIGTIAHQYLQDVPQHFSNAVLEDFRVMPNHLHAIIVIERRAGESDAGNMKAPVVETRQCRVSTEGSAHSEDIVWQPERFGPLKPGSLSKIVQAYKAAVTYWAHDNGYPSFAWQPRFHDHIIRNEQDLHRIRQYIRDNPLRWEMDRYYR